MYFMIKEQEQEIKFPECLNLNINRFIDIEKTVLAFDHVVKSFKTPFKYINKNHNFTSTISEIRYSLFTLNQLDRFNANDKGVEFVFINRIDKLNDLLIKLEITQCEKYCSDYQKDQIRGICNLAISYCKITYLTEKE